MCWILLIGSLINKLRRNKNTIRLFMLRMLRYRCIKWMLINWRKTILFWIRRIWYLIRIVNIKWIRLKYINRRYRICVIRWIKFRIKKRIYLNIRMESSFRIWWLMFKIMNKSITDHLIQWILKIQVTKCY
jgi:hypothetical protein